MTIPQPLPNPLPLARCGAHTRVRSAIRRAGLVVVLAASLAGCSQPAAEEAITSAIKALAAAIEARQSSTVMGYLDDEFTLDESRQGTLDREALKRLMMLVFYRHREISIGLTQINVTLDPVRTDLAEASFNALVAGGSGGLLPDQAELYRLQSQWRRNGDDWQLLQLQAKRALEQ